MLGSRVEGLFDRGCQGLLLWTIVSVQAGKKREDSVRCDDGQQQIYDSTNAGDVQVGNLILYKLIQPEFGIDSCTNYMWESNPVQTTFGNRILFKILVQSGGSKLTTCPRKERLLRFHLNSTASSDGGTQSLETM